MRLLASLLCLPLASSLAFAEEVGPQEIAMAFLDTVRLEEIDLLRDTAMFPETTKAKQRTITERLDQLAEELEIGHYEVIAEKKNGDAAAVLISQTLDFDPSKVQVHAVALLRNEDGWRPAPIPASFENTGIRYIQPLATNARELEEWMLSERGKKLEEIRSNIRQQLVDKIAATLTKDELFEGPPEKLVYDFIEACRKRDLPAALAFLGGLEDPLPPSWQETVALTASGFRQADENRGNWSQLLRDRMLRATVFTEVKAKRAYVSLGDFDPLDTRSKDSGISIRHFTLTRNDAGFWRIDLPRELYTGSERVLHEGPSDPDLIAALPVELLKQTRADGFEDPKALGQALLRDAAQPKFGNVVRYVSVLDDNEDAALKAIRSYASLWRDFRDRQDIRILLDAEIDGDQACALFCELDPYNPELRKSRILRIKMLKADGLWRLAPEAKPSTDDFSEKLQEWSRKSREQERSEWLGKMGIKARIGGIPAEPAPDEAAAKTTATEWLQYLEAGQAQQIFERVAIFDDEDAIRRLFAYLGQELSSNSQLTSLGMHRNGRWSAVSVRHSQPDPRDPPIDLLHPIIQTSKGPKILPEGILYIADTRAREYLNKDVWKRLGERLPEEAVDELRVIHEKHTELCRENGRK